MCQSFGQIIFSLMSLTHVSFLIDTAMPAEYAVQLGFGRVVGKKALTELSLCFSGCSREKSSQSEYFSVALAFNAFVVGFAS